MMHKRVIAFPEYEAIIREVYPDGGYRAVQQRLPQFNKRQIIGRAQRLGLQRQYLWTTREDRVLAEHYPKHGIKACLPLLPGRSYDAIRQRVIRNNLQREKPMTLKELARECGISQRMYHKRRKKGMSHIEALMTPVNVAMRRPAKAVRWPGSIG